MHVLRSEALIRAHWLPDQSKTSCDQEPLWELIDSLIDQQTCCYWGLLSELINSPIDQNLLAITSSYQSSVTQEFINNLLAIGSFYQSSLAIWGGYRRSYWHPNWQSSFLRLGDPLRAHCISGSSKNSCYQEVISELIDSLIDRCDPELLSELIDTPVKKHILLLLEAHLVDI